MANLLIPQLVGPAQLAFSQQPTTVGAGATISPAVTVSVEDSLGNVADTDSSSVTLSLGNNPGGGTLSGTLTVTAVNGVATFNNLSINAAGSGYTLVATDTTVPGTLTATSAAFNIDTPPTVATPAAATPDPVTGATTDLSVLGADNSGEATLTYTWTATTLPSGAAQPTFSVNGTNAAQDTTATFSEAGAYVLRATIEDPNGGTVTSSVSVTVDQTATSLAVSPAAVVLASGETEQFIATLLDQFGAAMTTQPTFTWSATTGSIDSTGLFTSAGASGTVTAVSGSFSATAQVILGEPPTVATPAAASPNPVTGTTTNLSVLGADVGGESSLTYSWTATTLPAGAAQPTYSANGTNAAKNTTVTFSEPGTYVFQVAITDTSNLTVTSSVTVAVNSTATSISLSPGSSALPTGGQQLFTATVVNQFGNAISPSPALTWTATSGSISSNGLYNAPTAAGTTTIEADAGSLMASVTITLVAPAAWWKFDDGSGTAAADSSGNGYTGTINNATWTTGIYGDALQFNGTDSSVTASSILRGTENFTLGAWVNTSSDVAGSHYPAVRRQQRQRRK